MCMYLFVGVCVISFILYSLDCLITAHWGSTMGKRKQGHNWRARAQLNTGSDRETEQSRVSYTGEISSQHFVCMLSDHRISAHLNWTCNN